MLYEQAVTIERFASAKQNQVTSSKLSKHKGPLVREFLGGVYTRWAQLRKVDRATSIQYT